MDKTLKHQSQNLITFYIKTIDIFCNDGLENLLVVVALLYDEYF